MEKECGIFTVSHKKMTTDNPSNVYDNEGFTNDNNEKKTPREDDVGSSDKVVNVKTTFNGQKEEPSVVGDAYCKVKRDDDGIGAYNNVRKESSGTNMGFTNMTSCDKGRERSKSIISDGPYRGMGKEELLRYSSRPLWRNLRYACMSIILTGWLALLITVIALVLTYPHCRDAERKDWWQKTVVYRIYVRSFSDSNKDGIGDIKGIIKNLDYLKETGVGTISLSPIYRLSTNAITDTHVIDHQDIDPVFGTLEDFKTLVNKTHAMGMHLVVDFIPNHTSDQHPWFIKSEQDQDPRTNEYRSYYVWKDGLGSNKIIEPNTWQSVDNCSAWSLSTNGGNSYYLHQFNSSQPELNLRSEKVRLELEQILKFWLDKGVDGFYIRDADFLFEDYDFRNDILVDNSTDITCSQNGPSYPYSAYSHHYTKGLTEVFDMLARWRAFVDNYNNMTNTYKILLSDADGSYDHVMNYYGLFNRDGVDIPLNKFSLNFERSGKGVAAMVDTWLSRMPVGRWPNWMGGDDRSERLTDRLGPDMAQPYLILTMLLPGTAYLYYGDEIGMRESYVVSPPHSRELPMRGPMLWNNQTHAGFCPNYCSQPWIPVYKGYKTENINVEAQKSDPYSMWHLVRNLTELRRENPSFEYGDYVKSIQDDDVFSFVREFDGEDGFLIALNFANKKVRKYFTGTHDTIPGGGTIVIVSGRTSRRRGEGISLNPLTLEPYQGIVVSWEYKAKEI